MTRQHPARDGDLHDYRYTYNIQEMAVTDEKVAPWLLLIFSLPAKYASQRVGIWRKLQRYGTVALKSAGHVLPNTAMNLERMEWLASTIRSYKGQASVAQVHDFDDLPAKKLKEIFIAARSREYDKLAAELKRLRASGQIPMGRLTRIHRQLEELVSIDFFGSPARARVETLLTQCEEPATKKNKQKRSEFTGRVWITRTRPGIDRVSSAWLIRNFIDTKARFVFDADRSTHPDAVPFDMFVSDGFGHSGDDCTFETLCKEFTIRDSRIKHISQIIHDADLRDKKFGRSEELALDKILNGWESQGLSDEELLKRGMELIEGLYNGLSS